MIATKFWVRPSFDFKGAGSIFNFGAAMLVAHGFWIVQSQSDIFIAGRAFDNHNLGLYAEALFLTQIFAAKFVPPLNEVAFPAYARLQNDKAALSAWLFEGRSPYHACLMPALSRHGGHRAAAGRCRHGAEMDRSRAFGRDPCRSRCR